MGSGSGLAPGAVHGSDSHVAWVDDALAGVPTRTLRCCALMYRRRFVLSLILPAFTWLGGCYRYAPVSPSEIRPGVEVRARLSAVAVDRIRQGPEAQARMLQGFTTRGRIMKMSADSVVIGVERTELEANVRARTTMTDFPLLRTDIQQFELRQLSRRRTALTAAGLGAFAIAAVVISVERGGRSTGTTPPPGGAPEQRVPLAIRFRFP